MPPKLRGSSAAGKQPKDTPPPLAFKYGECARSTFLDAKISTQKPELRLAQQMGELSLSHTHKPFT
eukprot:32-Rhodomonas_salina.1